MKQIAKGNFSPAQLKKYLIIGYAIITVFLVLSYITYELNYFFGGNPQSINYSMLTTSFSELGSPESWNNPNYWYLLSIAFGIWAFFCIPLILYMVRRMAVIDKVGAVFGFILLLVGAIGVLLIGVFPDTGQDFFQDLAYGKIHNTVAIVALGGMGLGILWFGVVLLRDRWTRIPKLPWTPPSGRKLFTHKKLQWPVIILFIAILLFAGFSLSWNYIYPIWHAQDPSIQHWPGWGPFSFPLWEWILILSIFLTFAWFVLALPYEIPTSMNNIQSFIEGFIIKR